MPKASKDEPLQEIAEQLTNISDSLEGIHDELADISATGKMLIFFKLIEIRPELKEKLGPMIDEMAEAMYSDAGEAEE